MNNTTLRSYLVKERRLECKKNYIVTTSSIKKIELCAERAAKKQRIQLTRHSSGRRVGRVLLNAILSKSTFVFPQNLLKL